MGQQDAATRADARHARGRSTAPVGSRSRIGDLLTNRTLIAERKALGWTVAVAECVNAGGVRVSTADSARSLGNTARAMTFLVLTKTDCCARVSF